MPQERSGLPSLDEIRAKSRQLREDAGRVTEAGRRNALLAAAEEYERLAAELERVQRL